MRSFSSTLGPLFLVSLLAACAGDNFAADTSPGAGGATGGKAGGPAGGTTGAGATSAGTGGASGTAGGATPGKGGAGAGDQGLGGADAGAGGAASDGGSAGSDTGGSGNTAGKGGAPVGGASAQGGAAGKAGKAGSGGSGTGGNVAGSSGSGGNVAGSSGSGAGGNLAGSGGSGAGGNVAGSSGSGAGGNVAGAGGNAAGSGGAGASAGSGGGAGASGGTSGTPCGAAVAGCAADSYCAADQTCRSCAVLDELGFGPAVPRVVPGGGRSELDFPRVADSAGRVLYHRARVNGQDDIFAFELDALSVPGAARTVACCVNKPTHDSGALLLPPAMDGDTFGAIANHGAIVGGAVPYMLLDSRRDFNLTSVGGGSNPTGDPARRRIHIAQWDRNATGMATDLNGYGPVPLLNTGNDDYSVAFASGAPVGAQRFYWMSKRGVPEQTMLRTLVLGETADQSQPVAVTLVGCATPVVINDFRPWITPEGTRLIFNARCTDSDTMKLWVTTPAGNGTLPAATLLPIEGSLPQVSEVGGSLSPNKCELWFMRGGQVHSARRK